MALGALGRLFGQDWELGSLEAPESEPLDNYSSEDMAFVELSLQGRPDILIEQRAGDDLVVAPVDLKISSPKHPDTEAGYRVQLPAYAALLSRYMGADPSRGWLCYGDRREPIAVEHDAVQPDSALRCTVSLLGSQDAFAPRRLKASPSPFECPTCPLAVACSDSKSA